MFWGICTFSLFAQSDVPDLKKYEDENLKLYSSKVIELQGKTQKDLILLFKNWGATTFANFKNVLISETENQIVLVYIEEIPLVVKSLGMAVTDKSKQYVRIVAEFKEGKCRISLYDDGNAPRTTETTIYSNPSVPARSYYMVDIIQKLQKPSTIKDYTKPKFAWYPTAIKYQENLDNLLISAEEGIKNPTATSPKRKDDF
jgi:hypothetical protein